MSTSIKTALCKFFDHFSKTRPDLDRSQETELFSAKSGAARRHCGRQNQGSRPRMERSRAGSLLLALSMAMDCLHSRAGQVPAGMVGRAYSNARQILRTSLSEAHGSGRNSDISGISDSSKRGALYRLRSPGVEQRHIAANGGERTL